MRRPLQGRGPVSTTVASPPGTLSSRASPWPTSTASRLRVPGARPVPCVATRRSEPATRTTTTARVRWCNACRWARTSQPRVRAIQGQRIPVASGVMPVRAGTSRSPIQVRTAAAAGVRPGRGTRISKRQTGVRNATRGSTRRLARMPQRGAPPCSRASRGRVDSQGAASRAKGRARPAQQRRHQARQGLGAPEQAQQGPPGQQEARLNSCGRMSQQPEQKGRHAGRPPGAASSRWLGPGPRPGP